MTGSRQLRLGAFGCALAAALAGVGGLAPTSARAAFVPPPATPTGIHVAKVSSSSFTVTVGATSHVRKYRLFAALNKADLQRAKIGRDPIRSSSSNPNLTLKDLRYKTSPYYFRIETMNGTKRRFSAPVSAVGLRPAMPQRLVARTANATTSLTWAAGPATGFSIEQATDPAMTQNVHKYTILGSTHQFTPYNVAAGRTYYYRVRALNDSTPSSYSPVVSTTSGARHQSVSVMTYNILEATSDGQREGSGRVAPWSRRKVAAARLIKHANPDVIGIQEGAAWAGRPRGPRQVDSLRAALGGKYKLAHTEITASHPHWMRTGVYILYKKSAYSAVGKGNHWDIGNARWAAYQELRNRATGARFLFVSTHLLNHSGRSYDVKREAETKRLLHDAQRLAERRHVPVVYVGDFNSDVWHHAFNGPSIAMRQAGVADAFNAAQSRVRPRYNTANNYWRRPPHTSARLDYVFAPAGVSVGSWKLVMDLHHGKFVGTIPSDHNPVLVHLRFPY